MNCCQKITENLELYILIGLLWSIHHYFKWYEFTWTQKWVPSLYKFNAIRIILFVIISFITFTAQLIKCCRNIILVPVKDTIEYNSNLSTLHNQLTCLGIRIETIDCNTVAFDTTIKINETTNWYLLLI